MCRVRRANKANSRKVQPFRRLLKCCDNTETSNNSGKKKKKLTQQWDSRSKRRSSASSNILNLFYIRALMCAQWRLFFDGRWYNIDKRVLYVYRCKSAADTVCNSIIRPSRNRILRSARGAVKIAFLLTPLPHSSRVNNLYARSFCDFPRPDIRCELHKSLLSAVL